MDAETARLGRDLPCLLADREAIEHNVALMARWCADRDVVLAPHAKTTMSPWVLERQVAAGAWGLTAATPRQARDLDALGAARVLLANEVVDPRFARWAVGRWYGPDVEPGAGDPPFCCYVDGDDGVGLLEAAVAGVAGARPLPVLVEVGHPDGRTGVRDPAEAVALARRVHASPHLALHGVAGYEGLLPRGDAATPPGLAPFLAAIHRVADAVARDGLADGDPPLVSAGGSAWFDEVVAALGPTAFDHPVRTVLRSGCYVVHDHGMYERTSPLGARAGDGTPRLRAALTLRADVLSRPEEGLLVAGFGRRDVPFDDALPRVLRVLAPDGADRDVGPDALTVTGLNDQHAYLRVDGRCAARAGDTVEVGISHPCGALDRWRSVPVVDIDLSVVGDLAPRL